VNLLLINHYAGSPRHGMEFRPYYLAREWVRAGHRVKIVAAAFSHVRSHQPELPDRGSKPLDEVIDGVEYRWLPAPAYRGNGIGRARNIAAFLSRLWRESHRLVDAFQPNTVIASSTYPMDIWVARRLARRAKARLVYEVHDLWPASPIELGGMSPRHPFIRLVQKAENDAYRDADLVISMLPCVAEHMRSHGLDLRRLSTVPNGVDPTEWEGETTPLEPDLERHLACERSAGRIVVGYAGSHGLPNALDTLLDAAALLKDERFAFVLVGDGHEKERLARRVREEKLERVALFPPIARSRVPAFLRALDIAYIGWRRQPIYRFGIAPNKLMDYMMAGRVVLHSVDAGNDPVADAQCGLTVPPQSAQAVVDGLHQLARLAPAERAAMGARGRAHVLANHAYPVLAQRFLSALTDTAP